MNYRHAAVLGVAVFASACAERGGQLLAPSPGPAASAEVRVDALARAFALGMAVPQVRAAVRDAMRGSLLTEHKLSLQQFLTSAEGEVLVDGAANAVGSRPGELKATVAGLPALDFYVPVRQHRLRWRGDRDYVVAVSLNGRAPTFGYGPDGRSVPLDLSRPEPPAEAVLMLQTAEPASRRVGPQREGPGLTIQDAADGELGGTLVITDSRGVTRTMELADLVNTSGDRPPRVICDVDCSGGGGGGGGGPPPPETFLTYIETHGIVDNNNPFESNEFEFSATEPFSGTTGFLRITGIGSSTSEPRHDHLIYAVPLSDQSPMTIAVKETDGWPNPDDHFYLADTGYCGPVPLGSSKNLVYWPLTEDSCNVFDTKNLV